MSTFIGTDGGEPFGDDMRLDPDIDLVAELADQAAQGALISYGSEDRQRSPLGRMLDATVAGMRSAGRNLPPAIIEAQERFVAARTALSQRMIVMGTSVSQYRMLGIVPRSSPKKPAHILSGGQARVARGLLGWTQADLAKRAKVALTEVREIEGDRPVAAATLTRVRRTFEAVRVEIAGSASPRLRA